MSVTFDHKVKDHNMIPPVSLRRSFPKKNKQLPDSFKSKSASYMRTAIFVVAGCSISVLGILARSRPMEAMVASVLQRAACPAGWEEMNPQMRLANI